MIKTSRAWIMFVDDFEKIEKLKAWGLLSQTATKIKTYLYKGIYTNDPMPCSVIGYVDDNEIILEIEGEQHSIMPSYLKEMQEKQFKHNTKEMKV